MLTDDLQDFGIASPSFNQSQTFRDNIYMKYLDVVSQHIKNRFPDVDLLEAFSMFDGKSWPEDEALLQEFGRESLQVLMITFLQHL